MPPKRKGASKGLLAHLVPVDPSVTEDESLESAIMAKHGGEPLPITGLKGVIAPPEVPVPVEAMNPRCSLKELLAQVDPAAPLAEDLLEWERTPPVGREFGAVRTLPVSRVRRELQSLLRRGETVQIIKNGRAMALLTPAHDDPDAEAP